MKSKEAYRTKSPEIEHKKEENESGITLKDCKNNIEDYDIKEVLGLFYEYYYNQFITSLMFLIKDKDHMHQFV